MHKHRSLSNLTLIVALALSVLLMAACGNSTPQPENDPTVSPPSVVTTETPIIPTPTPRDLAAIVNGENITLEQYQSEMNRYQAASGTELATEEKQQVLDDLIDQTLLAQAAQESGFIVDDQMITEKIEQLVSTLGSQAALDSWISVNGYTEESFKQDLMRATAAAWMRDQIIGQVPEEMEQVHARQILLYNSNGAEQALEQLNQGTDFETLAAEYDPVTYGDLGWFPRGYLLDDKLEEVVFNLQPGEYSDIIQTSAGFHIVQVIEREDQHTVDPAVRLDLQDKALQDWLADRRDQSQIQIMIS